MAQPVKMPLPLEYATTKQLLAELARRHTGSVMVLEGGPDTRGPLPRVAFYGHSLAHAHGLALHGVAFLGELCDANTIAQLAAGVVHDGEDKE